MNRETGAVEKWKESELQGTGTVKLGTSDCSSGSHHSGAPDWGCDFHFLYTKSTEPEPCHATLESRVRQNNYERSISLRRSASVASVQKEPSKGKESELQGTGTVS